ncbi:MAG: HDOD domain-containing protein [Gammaproteobacteria bacterium]
MKFIIMNQARKMQIGRFEVRRRLGGGMQGKVYLGWDPNLEREVAIKLITPAEGDKTYSEEIIKEAKIVARIANPNVVPLYEVGMYGDMPLLVFEYVDGVSLKQYIKDKGKLDEREALSIMVRIASGLHTAHEQGIVHLDLSPNNIMIDRQLRPRIMDFGLARISAAMDAEKIEKIMGTPRYMSPEHVAGNALTPATDIYALGLIFYECLTGQHAINQTDMDTICDAIKTAKIDWSLLQRLDVTAEVIAVIRDMVQVNPKYRYQDAAALVTSLDEVIEIKRQDDNNSLSVEFLLRRLNRRPEFPACSNSIMEINKLTDENTNTDFNKLGAVIIRDYSLTNRVMKIANSVIFDRGNGGVKTISQAISRLGLKLVRMICNGLLLFKQVEDKDNRLKDILVASFVAGLIARHVVSTVKRALAEEAFICALFHKLGTHLLVFYLPDEYEEISRLVADGETTYKAERRILSTSTAAIGKAVARKWNFPGMIIESMKPLPQGALTPVQNNEDILMCAANYGNELCELIKSGHQDIELLIEVETFLGRYNNLYSCDAIKLSKLVHAAAVKFSELAPGLGISYSDSQFCNRLEQFSRNLETALANQQQHVV